MNGAPVTIFGGTIGSELDFIPGRVEAFDKDVGIAEDDLPIAIRGGVRGPVIPAFLFFLGLWSRGFFGDANNAFCRLGFIRGVNLARGILDDPDVMLEGMLRAFLTGFDFAIGYLRSRGGKPEYLDGFIQFVFESKVGFDPLLGTGLGDGLDGCEHLHFLVHFFEFPRLGRGFVSLAAKKEQNLAGGFVHFQLLKVKFGDSFLRCFKFQQGFSQKIVIEKRAFLFFGWVDKVEGFDAFFIRGLEPEVALVANALGFDGFLLDKISEPLVEGGCAFKILVGSLRQCK